MKARNFLIAVVAVASVLVVVGWLTGLRLAMHGALLTAALFAFFPFVILAGGLLLTAALGVALTVGAVATQSPALVEGSGGAGEAVVEGGFWLTKKYYRFLARQRHPVFWGAPCGVLLGGLALWALIAALVIPGETRTVAILGEEKAKLERFYEEKGEYPPSIAPVVDGFGRPLQYEVARKWKASSYVLRSAGFDVRSKDDDLCVAGANKLGRWLERLRTGLASTQEQLAGIRAMTCEP